MNENGGRGGGADPFSAYSEVIIQTNMLGMSSVS